MDEAKKVPISQTPEVSGELGGELGEGAFLDLLVDPADLEHLAGDATITESATAIEAGPLELSLGDLLPNVEGSVVVLTDDNVPVNLVTNEPLAGSGVVDEHVSSGGIDVEGLYYYSFENGLTLYSDTDIVIISETLGT